ncbi:i-AAA protease YME1 [Cyberlindnera jadinii NRRL Y-1542]|uniref:Subunit of the mitochondrial inner membrane i-AAA protease complex n=1 Tax=Cyberlindnera jadinii (strain ATCC 18201 / CBS 1600 / BCRC 20928 / JCM 3617 / NBRC 0987 / NRRL Y-1542) TaxID=983966 RepID=A0A1E4S1I2_CYBJN|nr:subunit of the mitochondrial inner membrane i-AAA protease complex [Cyberlindnera jadinii NRRL Y-1542]ODV73365.1 subunit of the mitochondrial inner membrane i-AAA protease complex [Cyberlindnera jadinii NRRL Y-1542]
MLRLTRCATQLKSPRALYILTRAASTSTQATLAAKEQTANQELENPRAQADFYKSLLKANYPQYVVSRYESPGIATSTECAHLYADALKKLGKMKEAEAVKSQLAKGSLSGAGLHGNGGAAFGAGGSYGSRNNPVYVVVAESTWTMISKWLKFLIPIGLLTWGVMEGFTYLVESGTIFKNSESSDKSVDMSKVNVKFDDVRGADEARAELEEIVDFLKDPTKFTGLGGKLPKGVLLTGPPGTGKTLLARATAGEAGVPFFFMSGSEFDELYVGVGAKRVRELFSQARAHSPAIIFIDELDAIGGKRNPRDQAYAKQTLNQLLVELDGFSQTSGIIIIGATNFPESLDKALTRPGRFDKIVNVDLPDVRGRADILRHHMKNVEIAKDVDPTIIARGTPGLSGAELMNLVNQAAVHASQQNALAVDMNHFEWAKDKILMGAARKTMVITEASRRATAYHEAGHAIMALYTPGATSLYKATILPRGRALGITFQLPEMDKIDITKKECIARLDVCMGGKVAEEMIYGAENTTSGCGSDLSSATGTARAMVTQYGMSDKVGPISLAEKWDSWSPKLRDVADQEVVDMLKESENRTRRMLHDKKVELERLAQGLIEYETLTKDEIIKVVNGEPLSKAKQMTNTVVESPDSDERKGVDKQPFPIPASA